MQHEIAQGGPADRHAPSGAGSRSPPADWNGGRGGARLDRLTVVGGPVAASERLRRRFGHAVRSDLGGRGRAPTSTSDLRAGVGGDVATGLSRPRTPSSATSGRRRHLRRPGERPWAAARQWSYALLERASTGAVEADRRGRGGGSTCYFLLLDFARRRARRYGSGRPRTLTRSEITSVTPSTTSRPRPTNGVLLGGDFFCRRRAAGPPRRGHPSRTAHAARPDFDLGPRPLGIGAAALCGHAADAGIRARALRGSCPTRSPSSRRRQERLRRWPRSPRPHWREGRNRPEPSTRVVQPSERRRGPERREEARDVENASTSNAAGFRRWARANQARPGRGTGPHALKRDAGLGRYWPSRHSRTNPVEEAGGGPSTWPRSPLSGRARPRALVRGRRRTRRAPLARRGRSSFRGDQGQADHAMAADPRHDQDGRGLGGLGPSSRRSNGTWSSSATADSPCGGDEKARRSRGRLGGGRRRKLEGSQRIGGWSNPDDADRRPHACSGCRGPRGRSDPGRPGPLVGAGARSDAATARLSVQGTKPARPPGRSADRAGRQTRDDHRSGWRHQEAVRPEQSAASGRWGQGSRRRSFTLQPNGDGEIRYGARGRAHCFGSTERNASAFRSLTPSTADGPAWRLRPRGRVAKGPRSGGQTQPSRCGSEAATGRGGGLELVGATWARRPDVERVVLNGRRRHRSPNRP